MSERVTMPALGESVTEGTVTRWLKNVGDEVAVDEPLLEVSTDKVDTEIPSPVAGTLTEILVQEDETVDVGADLAVIGDAGDAPSGDDASDTESAQEPVQESQQPEQSEPDNQPPQEPAKEPADEASATEAPSTEEDEPAKAPEAPTAPADSDSEGTKVAMPALGESVTEGTVTRWLKNVGDEVAVDEPLLEVSTDKVDTEIPSPVAGTLTEILVQEDETVDVGADLAVIGGGSGSRSGAQQSSEADAPEPGQQESGADDSRPAEAGQPDAQGDTQTDTTAGSPDESAADALPADGEGGDVEDQIAGQDEAPSADAEQPSTEGSGAAASSATGSAAETQTAPPPASGSGATTQSAPPPATPSSPSASSDTTDSARSTDTSSAPPADTQQADANAPDASSYVTPLVRKIAEEKGVDLGSITGTGVGGRIRKQDVLAAAESATQSATQSAADSATAPAAETTSSSGSASGAAQAPTAQGMASTVPPSKRGTREKMTRLRKVIAQRMVESLQVSAQLTTVVEVDMTKVARVRDRAKADFERREGTKLTFLPFIALATAEALKAHPNVNASVEGEEIVYHGQENLSIAVDTEKGLLTPVVKNAGDLNVAGLARAIADVAERTRTNKITPDDLAGGTFTITNTGSRGALFDTPILNQPQVGMLGTGAIVKRPVVVTDADGGETIAVRSMMYLAMTYDHRVVDGADAARFLGTVKARLEDGAFEA